MRKTIGVKGEIMQDDLIATLEQENRQLHARNQRLEKELEGMIENSERNAIDDLRNKLNMGDDDKFSVFRTSVSALAKCFEKGNKGVLIADIGDKVSIMGINAEIHEVALMASATAIKLGEVIDEMQDEDRVLN